MQNSACGACGFCVSKRDMTTRFFRPLAALAPAAATVGGASNGTTRPSMAMAPERAANATVESALTEVGPLQLHAR